MSGKTVDVSTIKGNTDVATSSRAASMLNDEGDIHNPVTSGTQLQYGSWTQYVAATAHTVRGLEIVAKGAVATSFYRIGISTGTPGNELTAIKKTCRIFGTGLASLVIPVDESLIPKGSRVSVAAWNETAASADTVNVALTLQEKND